MKKVRIRLNMKPVKILNDSINLHQWRNCTFTISQDFIHRNADWEIFNNTFDKLWIIQDIISETKYLINNDNFKQ